MYRYHRRCTVPILFTTAVQCYSPSLSLKKKKKDISAFVRLNSDRGVLNDVISCSHSPRPFLSGWMNENFY